jgi:hypothetical protein
MDNTHTTQPAIVNNYALIMSAAFGATLAARAAYNGDTRPVRNADMAALAAAIKAYNDTTTGLMDWDTPYNNATNAADAVYNLAVHP